MRFGANKAKVKVFRLVKSDDDLDLVDAGNELLEELKINGVAKPGKPLTQANQVKGRADKSLVPETRRS